MEIPKCSSCGKPLKEIYEDIRGLRLTWELREDGKYHEVNKDHYGETYAYCGNCEADIGTDGWDFWLDRVA